MAVAAHSPSRVGSRRNPFGVALIHMIGEKAHGLLGLFASIPDAVDAAGGHGAYERHVVQGLDPDVPSSGSSESRS